MLQLRLEAELVPDVLRAYRNRTGKTQAELARQAFVSPTIISRLERREPETLRCYENYPYRYLALDRILANDVNRISVRPSSEYPDVEVKKPWVALVTEEFYSSAVRFLEGRTDVEILIVGAHRL